MKILFDQGTPVPLRFHLQSHEVKTTAEQGWSTLQNGTLLREAIAHGYEVFITTDQNLKYQQNLKNPAIAILVLTSTSWPRIKKKAREIRTALNSLSKLRYIEVEI